MYICISVYLCLCLYLYLYLDTCLALHIDDLAIWIAHWGLLHSQGRGVAADPEMAVQWYRRAAEQDQGASETTADVRWSWQISFGATLEIRKPWAAGFFRFEFGHFFWWQNPYCRRISICTHLQHHLSIPRTKHPRPGAIQVGSCAGSRMGLYPSWV